MYIQINKYPPITKHNSTLQDKIQDMHVVKLLFRDGNN